jgi:predicted nuclease with TOPRIM domain
MTSIECFKTEIERLNKELQQASCDKIRAAEYGLAVLEEKQSLQEQYDELETLLDSTKQELESSKEVRIVTDLSYFSTIYLVGCSFIAIYCSDMLMWNF